MPLLPRFIAGFSQAMPQL